MALAGHTRNTNASHRARGYTLAESLLASVVLALAVAAVTGALVSSQQQTQVQHDDALASALVRQLMEEVAARPLVLPDGTTGQPGWPTVTDRLLYDTTGDFNGYSDTVDVSVARAAATPGIVVNPPGAADLPQSPLPALKPQQYRRNVSVTAPTQLFGQSVSNGDFALVTVTVRSATGNTAQARRLVAATTFTR